jgi:chaperonin GroES
MVTKIRPLHDRVLVERLEQEQKTAGGIIIPDTAQEKPMRGKVVAVGNGTKAENGTLVPLDVKVGDIVLFAKWGGTEINIDSTEYLVMKEVDILAIIESK